MNPSTIVSHKDDFSEQLEGLRERVRRHCLKILKSEAEAEDAVQESLAKAWQQKDTFRADSPLGNWVMRISTNHCLNRLRKKVVELVEWDADKEVADPLASFSMSSAEQQVWLKQTLTSLQACMGERDFWMWRQKIGGMTEADIVRNLPPVWALTQHGVHSCFQRGIKTCLEREKNVYQNSQ